MPNTIVAMFDDIVDAHNAEKALISSGFPQNQISVITQDSRGSDAMDSVYEEMDEDEVPVAVGAGPASSSAGIGEGIGLGTGVSNRGGLFGGLYSQSVMGEDAGFYAEGIRRGGAVLTVQTDDEEVDRAEAILNRYGAVDIDERSSKWREQGWSGYDPNARPLSVDRAAEERSRYESSSSTGDKETKIPVVEEELQVGKRQVRSGGVRVYSHVTEKPVEEKVQLREERVTVDRHPIDRPATEADFSAAQEGTIEVTETIEQPVVSKQARVIEEVVIGKEVEQRTETVKDTVRRTDVEVEPLGTNRSAEARAFERYDADFRRNFTTVYGSGGGAYDEYLPAYRYGYDLAGDNRYEKKEWSAIEADARRDWETSHPGGTWDRFKDAIRYGWDKTRNPAIDATTIPTGNTTPGVQTGGRTADGAPDTRGVMEKAADAITGDRIDDKTGKRV